MYTITVDDKDLYIPDSEDYQVSSASISVNTDSVAYLDMEVPSTNKGLKEIEQQASIVKVYENDIMRYKLFVDKIDYDFEGTASVHATSVLAYLNDSLVRPYSTIDSEEGLTAPSSVNGYFNWLIEQHNKNIKDTKKTFYVGVNQGASLDHNNYIYRSSKEVPTTSDEIRNKILDSYGAYITLTFNGDQNVINLYADVHDANEQVIDFGVNLLDLTKTISTEDSYTVVRPSGAVPETDNHSTSLPITISSIPDGISKWDSDVYKIGDTVYSISGVKKYGYKEYEYSNTDVSSVEYLYQLAVSTLKKLVNPYLTIEVKAVDLALLYMKKYRPMEVGQSVRVRSEPHGVDEYLRISEISIDLLDPSQDSYTLGESYDSLTGQQSGYMQKLNSNINKSFDIVGSSADAANKLANIAKKNADEADKKAEQAKTDASAAGTKADEANAKADTATDTANNANAKADEAKADAANASSKADEANTKADTATETANSASSKADTAISNSKDAADKAAAASQKADVNTAKITTVENTIKTISGDTATAIANAKAAQAAADAAKKAADQAQSDADTANTEIGKVQSQVGTINTEISNIKQEATDLRDDLSGQITTVKNTMEADYTRKTELSDTTATLRNEISESAAGVIHTVSQDYATKKELKTTTDATNKNAADLTNAIKKFNSDVDNLQGQIDGAIETWFYDVDPTDKNEPAVNWNTDTLKKTHLGDLYYNTVSGYCWRYQLQNGSYSWSRITDVDVTKALADAAAAQSTANSKKRIFVTTPNPPYDVGDLWTQGSNGDIMRCQTAKTSSQSYAAADWIKASKYTDDTAVTKLSNTVEKTYSTKTEVKQLSDQVSSTVSSLETVRVSAVAAQTSADNAKKAADAAQTSADTAKANAATAQSKADEAAKNLAAAEKNLKTLQSQANATDEQLTAAKAEVEKAKTAAATAQSTANTAKANAATAQSTADTAKANAKTAQDDVNALKNRVTAAETSIKQNSDAIALRATKTEVTSAIDNVNIGGRNLLLGTGTARTITGKNTTNQIGGSYIFAVGSAVNLSSGEYTCQGTITGSVDGGSAILQFNGTPYIATSFKIAVSTEPQYVKRTITFTENASYTATGIAVRLDNVNGIVTLSDVKFEKGNKPTDWSPAPEDIKNDATAKADNALALSKTYTDAQLKISSDSITSTVSKTYATKTDLETTNDNVTKAQNAADSANTAATNAQSTADSASSAASKAQQTANDVTKNLADNYTSTVDMNSKIEQTANSIKSEVSEVYQPKGDYATNSSVQSAIEQSASSITSTVSKTYATKTSVDTLQNIADNAIESWYLVGVPSGENKPASDWTTDALKKQHVGDMYYDKDTGYSYRWLQEGTAYKWVQIKDNDITNANAVANEAKSTAKSAESTANAAKTTADNASATADTASTKADDAATDAATAKSDASTAKTTANTAKSTADAASNTASEAKTTADSVKNDLAENYTTTVDMNSKIEQTANSITSTVSKTYATKTEVTSAIDNVNIGGRNLAHDTSNDWSEWVTPKANSKNVTKSSGSVIYFPSEINVGDEYYIQCEVEFDNVTPSNGERSCFAMQGSVDGKWEANKFNPWNYSSCDIKNGIIKISKKKTSYVKPTPPEVYADCAFRVDYWATGRYRWRRIKVELGNKPTDWSPAPEDLMGDIGDTQAGVDSLTTRITSAETKIEQNSEAISLRATKTEVTEVKSAADTAKANAATAVSTANTAKSTADAASKTASTASTNASNAVDTANDAKNTADTASDTAATANATANTAKSASDTAIKTANTAKSTADTVKTDLETNYSTTTQMNSAIDVKADGIISTVSKTYQVKGDYAIKSEVDQTIEGVETKITTVTNTANTAKSTADAASKTANTAKSTADTAAKDSAAAKTAASTANTNASNAQTTANSALSSTQTLETLIRQSGDGVEVAKKVNGEYTSTKTLMGSDGFYIKDSDGTNLTQVTSDSAIIGKESATHMQIKSDGMSIKDASNKILAGFYDANISLNNGHFKLNTITGNKTFSYIDTDGDFCLQSNRDEAFSNRCIIRSNYIPGAGRQSNRLDLIASGSKNDSNVGLAQISITGSGTDNASSSVVEVHADYIEFNNNQLSDFVVAEGTSNRWYYRKWASGKAEAMMWMKHRLTSWAWWNTNSYIKYGMPLIPDVALPFKFVTIYCTMRTTSNRIDDASETFVVGGHLDSDHTKWVGGYICSPSGDIDRIVDTDVQFYISGTWK